MTVLDFVQAEFWACLGYLSIQRILDWLFETPEPLFRCSGCHKDIYPPVIKSMHYRDKSYCSECEAKYFLEAAEAL